jgi:hypothetical protein
LLSVTAADACSGSRSHCRLKGAPPTAGLRPAPALVSQRRRDRHVGDAKDGDANLDRNTANATLRTWIGVHCDAIADAGGDATEGADSSRSKTTYYQSDQVHPTVAAIIET